jgi:hypothetical protein
MGIRVVGGKLGDLCGVRTVFMLDEPKSRRTEVRAPIVARKRRNGRGAKGCRKRNA